MVEQWGSSRLFGRNWHVEEGSGRVVNWSFGATTMARTTFLGTVRNGITNLMGGVRGYQNLAAWGVAVSTAYFLWVKPELDLKREQEARLALSRENDRYRYVERTRPTSQDGGTTFGKAKESS